MATTDFLGLEFNDLSVSEVVHQLRARPRAARFTYVVTPNTDHFSRLRHHPALRHIYERAWLRLMDSRALARTAHLIGLPAPQVTTGADLTAALLATLEPQPVAVIGLASALMDRLRQKYPHLSFLHHAPPQNLLMNDLAFRRARDFAVRANARFTFIALGSPLQELLAYAIARQPGSAGIGLCIGAALEYCAGTPRAPRWMQRAGLEWLYRLARDPGRLSQRYLLDDPPVLLTLLAARFSRTMRQSPPGPHPQSPPAAIAANDPYPPPRPAPLQKIPDAG
jgi:exopolysaccharide biosynthesis WecB/TagA/CpsF family protein